MPVTDENGGEGFVSDAPNLLSQLIHAPNFEAITKVNLNLVEDGDTAGITVTGGNYYCIRVENCGGKFIIKQTNYEHSYPEHKEKLQKLKKLTRFLQFILKLLWNIMLKQIFIIVLTILSMKSLVKG